MPESAERAAIIKLPFSFLAELLQLPPAAKIDVVLADPTQDRMVTLRVRGAGWATAEGELITSSTGTVTDYVDDLGKCFKRVIRWDMPPPQAAEQP
jgi:hypothetical protein